MHVALPALPSLRCAVCGADAVVDACGAPQRACTHDTAPIVAECRAHCTAASRVGTDPKGPDA